MMDSWAGGVKGPRLPGDLEYVLFSASTVTQISHHLQYTDPQHLGEGRGGEGAQPSIRPYDSTAHTSCDTGPRLMGFPYYSRRTRCSCCANYEMVAGEMAALVREPCRVGVGWGCPRPSIPTSEAYRHPEHGYSNPSRSISERSPKCCYSTVLP